MSGLIACLACVPGVKLMHHARGSPVWNTVEAQVSEGDVKFKVQLRVVLLPDFLWAAYKRQGKRQLAPPVVLCQK